MSPKENQFSLDGSHDSLSPNQGWQATSVAHAVASVLRLTDKGVTAFSIVTPIKQPHGENTWQTTLHTVTDPIGRLIPGAGQAVVEAILNGNQVDPQGEPRK